MAVTPNSIITPQTPKQAVNVNTTAETSYVTPVNTALLFVAGANGSRVTKITSTPRVTVTATNLLLFTNAAPSNTTLFLIDSVLMAANTLATTTATPKTDWGVSDTTPLYIAANASVYVAAQVAFANGIVTKVEYADY
jgi:hypothetical protein